ncbi:MAG: hypothetical protein ACOC35_13105, partial [Promethearchaeia archaeon]
MWEDDKEGQTDLDDSNYDLFDFEIYKFSQNFFYARKNYNTEKDSKIVRAVYEFSLCGTYQKIGKINLPDDVSRKKSTFSFSISNIGTFIASAINNSNQNIIFESYNNQCKELDNCPNSKDSN